MDYTVLHTKNEKEATVQIANEQQQALLASQEFQAAYANVVEEQVSESASSVEKIISNMVQEVN
jgi:hypothetical protein